jgi:phenylalanyl-tRNA synthetase alpha chain
MSIFEKRYSKNEYSISNVRHKETASAVMWVVPREFPPVPFVDGRFLFMDNAGSPLQDIGGSMLDKLNEIEKAALESLQLVQDQAALDAWRVSTLGRSSPLMMVFAGFGQLSKEERPVIGAAANRVKVTLESALAERAQAVKAASLVKSLAKEKLDVTLPGRSVHIGRLHPSTVQLRLVLDILAEMGFQVYTSREVETDEMNFQMLNFPPHHPAREMQDSFYVEAEGREDNPILLRTHTSPGQIRAMRDYAAMDPENPPSIRIVLPGMCFRYEQITARSEIQFNQVEGLAVGEGITFSDLKGTLINFAHRMFGQNARTRFRASYFPFTEPSAEMDIECFVCGGIGCQVCKNSGWLEILGCGMVHPVVLQNGGYDPKRYTGFAFGMGPERQLMLRNKINDIRYFWGNDVRFLEQF